LAEPEKSPKHYTSLRSAPKPNFGWSVYSCRPTVVLLYTLDSRYAALVGELVCVCVCVCVCRKRGSAPSCSNVWQNVGDLECQWHCDNVHTVGLHVTLSVCCQSLQNSDDYVTDVCNYSSVLMVIVITHATIELVRLCAVRIIFTYEADFIGFSLRKTNMLHRSGWNLPVRNVKVSEFSQYNSSWMTLKYSHQMPDFHLKCTKFNFGWGSAHGRNVGLKSGGTNSGEGTVESLGT